MLLHRIYLYLSGILHTKKSRAYTHSAVLFYTLSFGKLKKQDAYTSCFLVKPATCYFAALLRPLRVLRFKTCPYL